MFDNLDRIVTPMGTAVYPWLNTPDTKFDPDGEFKVNLRLSSEDSEKFMPELKKIHKDWTARVRKELGKKVKVQTLSVTAVVDDEGNETGEHDIKCKLNAKGKRKDGTVFDNHVRIFDSSGTPMNGSSDSIGAGSTIKVAISPRGYYVPAIGAGVTLRINAVQVIEMVAFTGSGSSAKDFGFKSEDGFEVETFEEPATVTSDNSNNDDEDF